MYGIYSAFLVPKLPSSNHLHKSIHNSNKMKDVSGEKTKCFCFFLFFPLKMYNIIFMHSKLCPKETRRAFSEFPECPMANGLISPFRTGA